MLKSNILPSIFEKRRLLGRILASRCACVKHKINVAMKYFLFLIFFIFNILCVAQPPIVDGWTLFVPSADSRIIYVSSSGNDATAQTYLPGSAAVGPNVFQPVGPIQPYATLAAAKAQLRAGFPDYLLLRSGDTWTNQAFGTLNIRGRNLNEPMLIGSYGTGARPRILTGESTGIELTGTDCSHVALVDLYLTPHTLGPGDTPTGILTFSPFANLTLENCVVTAFPSAIVAHGNSGARSNLRMRRCLVTHNAGYDNSTAQPIFLDNIDGILMEECLLDHNGWNTAIGSFPTAFKHNSYFQVHNSNVIFRKNIVARASATGIGMRCGGTVQDNLILENVNNLQFGTSETTINWPSESVTGEITGNVVIGARNESFDPGRAIFIAKAANVLVQNNIVKDYAPVAMSDAIIATDGYANLNLHQNIVYNWCPNIPFGPGTFFETNNGIFLSGGGAGTNIISQNHIQQHNPGGGCLRSTTFADKQFSQNRYVNPTPNNAFQSGNINYANWLAQSGETGSSYGNQSYTDPNRSIPTYLASIGASGGLAEFLATAATLSKTNWDSDYTAQSVIDYIRAGFDVSLPVQDLVLDAQAQRHSVWLRWRTEGERNSDFFELQHSRNGFHFEAIGRAKAAGQSHTPRLYEWEHRSPAEGNNYYRVRQVDFDGSAVFSSIVEISREEDIVRVFPNPGPGIFQVKMAKKTVDLHFRAWTAQGQLAQQGTLTNGILDLTSLKKGVYWVEFHVNSLILRQKIIIF
jgi:hypothetical protein